MYTERNTVEKFPYSKSSPPELFSFLSETYNSVWSEAYRQVKNSIREEERYEISWNLRILSLERYVERSKGRDKRRKRANDNTRMERESCGVIMLARTARLSWILLFEPREEEPPRNWHSRGNGQSQDIFQLGMRDNETNKEISFGTRRWKVEVAKLLAL